MFQHLDDGRPLPACSRDQRAAVIARGEHLRRRRRAALVGLPMAGAAVVTSAVLALSVGPGPAGDSTLTSAAPAPPPPLVFEEEVTRTGPAYSACSDPEGDSAGEPDVTLFSLDRPAVPFVHYHWEGGPVRIEGVAELRFEATSADGLRSRHLVARTTADGEVLEQFVRDPGTGARRDVPHSTEGPEGGGLAAGFPYGALSGLGDGWTWVGSLSIDGVVVDSCDPARPGGRS